MKLVIPVVTIVAATLIACSERTAPTAPRPSLTAEAAADWGSGEVWVAAQDANRVIIVHGLGSIETVEMPAGSGPHEITFSPSGAYAYVGDMIDGTLAVIRAADRQIVAMLALGSAGTHQGQPSPDGTLVLVSQIPSMRVIRITADEALGTWTVGPSLTLPLSPLCAAFRSDGRRAYVALRPSGIAIVDVASMTLLATLPTAGVVRCGLAPLADGRRILVASNGGGGHLYMLDTDRDMLTDLSASIGASDQQDVDVSPNGHRAYTTSFLTDELKLVDLTDPLSTAASVSLDATPGVTDKPDHVVVRGNTAFVTLGASGKLAVVQTNQSSVTYLDLAPPSATALHGIAVRP